jgi:hypothetical protein
VLAAISVAPVELVIDPPAVRDKLPELVMAPAFVMFLMAFKVRLAIGVKFTGRLALLGKLLVIKPPERLAMLSAFITTLLILALVESTYIDPALVKLPVRVKVGEVVNLPMAVTPWGITRLPIRCAS